MINITSKGAAIIEDDDLNAELANVASPPMSNAPQMKEEDISALLKQKLKKPKD